jgi:hypothetical protein
VVGRPAVKRRVRAPSIVGGQITADRGAGLADRAIGPQVNFVVFYRTPQALDEHVFAPGAAAIYADRYLLAEQDGGQRHPGKLAALIRVEDLRCPEARQRFFQSLDAEVGLQRDDKRG